MRIEFAQTGGIGYFPGLNKPVTVDVDRLDPAQAEELKRLVEAARFFDLPASIGAPARGAADYQYDLLTVEDGGRRHTVRVLVPVEDPVPPLAVAPVPVPGVLPPEPPWVIEPPAVEPVPALPLLPIPGLVELPEPDVVPDCADPDVLAPEPVPGLFVPDATSGQLFDPAAPLPLPLPEGDVCCAPAVSAIVTKAHVRAEVSSRFMYTPFSPRRAWSGFRR